MSRFRRRTRGEQPPGDQAAPATAPVDVQIGADGSCTIGGLPVLTIGDEPLHEAVLNYLHRLAMATGHPIRATVHDGRGRFIVPLEVQVDGSSRFAGEPMTMSEHEVPIVPPVSGGGSPHGGGPAAEAVTGGPSAGPALSKALPGQTAGETPALGPVPVPAPVPGEVPAAVPAGPAGVPEQASDQGRSREQDQARDQVSAPAPEPAEPVLPPPSAHERLPDGPAPAPGSPPATGIPPIPAHLTDAVDRINHSIQLGRIEPAAAMAHRSVADAREEFGADHPHVLQLQELCAHIAYLASDMARSMSISLEVARARQVQHDPRAYESLLRAAAVWPAVRDPREGLRLGNDLLAIWQSLVDEGGPAAADAAKFEAARRRMSRLAQRAARQGGDTVERRG